MWHSRILLQACHPEAAGFLLPSTLDIGLDRPFLPKGQRQHMATDTAPDLLQQWSLGELTVERAIGQLLQHLQQTRQQLTELEQRTRCLERLLNLKA